MTRTHVTVADVASLRKLRRSMWSETIRVPLNSRAWWVVWRDGIVGAHNLFAAENH